MRNIQTFQQRLAAIIFNMSHVTQKFINRPLFKNKGSVSDPDIYRGITLLSCTGKLFTACLNCRLLFYVEDHISGQEQAGFREGYSIIDYIWFCN